MKKWIYILLGCVPVAAILSIIVLVPYYVFRDSSLDTQAKTVVICHVRQSNGYYSSGDVARYNIDGKEVSVQVSVFASNMTLKIGIGPVTYVSQAFDYISTATDDACVLDKIFINDVEVPRKDITNFDQHQKNFEYYIGAISNIVSGSQKSILHSVLR